MQGLTVGRVVWYFPDRSDKGLIQLGPQPFKADVVYVHEDESTVNLSVFDHEGTHHKKLDVRHVDVSRKANAPDTHSFWDWMPFQKGQAKKTEEVEARLGTPPPAHPHPRDYEVHTAPPQPTQVSAGVAIQSDGAAKAETGPS